MFYEITGIILWGLFALLVLGRVLRWFKERPRLAMQDRWVVITGCDSGIGLGALEMLAAQGANVIACTYTAKGADRAAKACRKKFF